jgi:uroporphyrinogen-III synthase
MSNSPIFDQLVREFAERGVRYESLTVPTRFPAPKMQSIRQDIIEDDFDTIVFAPVGSGPIVNVVPLREKAA